MKSKKAFSITSIASTIAAGALIATLSGCASAPQKDAGDRQVLETQVDVSLNQFYGKATNARQIVNIAQGVLVCPSITKAGFVFGGEGGTCAMQINGRTTEYYRITAFKAGLLAGAETYSLLLVFNDRNALAAFRKDNRNWQVGGNFSASVAKKGASGAFDTNTMGAATTAYVYSQSGLMGDISVDGSTFKKLVD